MTFPCNLKYLLSIDHFNSTIFNPPKTDFRLRKIFDSCNFRVNQKVRGRKKLQIRRDGTPSNRKILFQLFQIFLRIFKYNKVIHIFGNTIFEKSLYILSNTILEVNNIILKFLVDKVFHILPQLFFPVISIQADMQQLLNLLSLYLG